MKSTNLKEYIGYFGRQATRFEEGIVFIEERGYRQYRMSGEEKDFWTRRYDRCHKDCRILARKMELALSKYKKQQLIPKDILSDIDKDISRTHNLLQRCMKEAKEFFIGKKK